MKINIIRLVDEKEREPENVGDLFGTIRRGIGFYFAGNTKIIRLEWMRG